MKILKILFLLLFLSTFSFSISLRDIDKIDRLDSMDYLEKAKKEANSENFNKSNDYLKKALNHRAKKDEYKLAKEYVSKKKLAYEARLERERQAKLERERKERARLARIKREKEQNYNNNENSLNNKCAFLLNNFGAWSACMRKKDNVFSLGKRGLNAYYAIKKDCSSLAANDNSGLSYLCQNENSSGCIGLNASSSTIAACTQCNGSNLWLRVYAMGVVIRCH